MKFALHSGSAVELKCDLLAVPVFEGELKENEAVTGLDAKLGGLLAKLSEEEGFKGKRGQTLSVHTHGKVGAQRVMLAGLGSRGDFDAAELRHVAAKAARAARPIGATSLGLVLGNGLDDERALQLTTEGFLAGR